MNPDQLLKADLLDIVFEDRNKDYGAYELRTHYSRRIGRAMLIAFALSGALLAAATYAPEEELQAKITVTGIVLDNVPVDDKPVIPPVVPPAAPPQTRTIASTTIRIVADDQPTDIAPTPEDLSNARVAITTNDGPDDIGISTGEQTVKTGISKGIIEVKSKETETIAGRVDVQAEFKGNWARFLTNNLRANTPVDNGIAMGRYSVTVEFVVDVDGTVSQIHALTSHGYGMEEEAVRVIRKSAKWIPAVNQGYPVKAYRKQVIVFDITGNE